LRSTKGSVAISSASAHSIYFSENKKLIIKKPYINYCITNSLSPWRERDRVRGKK